MPNVDIGCAGAPNAGCGVTGVPNAEGAGAAAPKAEGVDGALLPPETNADGELDDPKADVTGAGVPNVDGVLFCASAPNAEGAPNAEVAVEGVPKADVVAAAGVPNPVCPNADPPVAAAVFGTLPAAPRPNAEG